jgi:hypothetical protein
LDVLSICFRLLSLCGQVELANGASAEDLVNNRYYDAEAIHFIEEVCTFLTLDATHRQVVRPPPPPPLPAQITWSSCSYESPVLDSGWHSRQECLVEAILGFEQCWAQHSSNLHIWLACGGQACPLYDVSPYMCMCGFFILFL